ncbi:MAG TPA: hypothetical protein VGN17_04015 [Bryobacteraceae bacterium]|jgi:hypothetical protein
MRSYFSSHHLWAARYFVVRAIEVEARQKDIPRFDLEQRAFVTGAILSSVAFLEAAINEVLKDVADGHESYISPIAPTASAEIKAFWESAGNGARLSGPVLDRYQAVLRFCGEAEFSKGQAPYQDADSVTKLRNELIHYMPETLGGENQHKLGQRLSKSFPTNPLLVGSGNPYFPDHCLGSPCADWAVNSVRAFADSFFNKIGVSPNYMRVNFPAV